MPDLEVLGPLRHRCAACGGGCHGTEVTVLDEERQSLLADAAALGVEDPFDGDRLRQGDGGRCVFLSDDMRCRLHTERGPRAKPVVCQQYPLVGVQVGLAVRLVVDPGCMSAWRGWRDDPELPAAAKVLRSRGAQPMAWITEERGLIKLCDPALRTVGEVLSALSDEPVVDGLPVSLALTLIDRVAVSGLGPRLGHPQTATSIRERLAHVVTALPDLADRSWELGPEADAWAVEATRRFVFMRAPRETRPVVRALAMLTGAVVCGLADPEPARFGPAMSAWSRVMRTPAIELLGLRDVV